MADIALLLAEEYEKMIKKDSQGIEVFHKIEDDGYSRIKLRFGGDDYSNNNSKVFLKWGSDPKSQLGVAALSGFFSA